MSIYRDHLKQQDTVEHLYSNISTHCNCRRLSYHALKIHRVITYNNNLYNFVSYTAFSLFVPCHVESQGPAGEGF